LGGENQNRQTEWSLADNSWAFLGSFLFAVFRQFEIDKPNIDANAESNLSNSV